MKLFNTRVVFAVAILAVAVLACAQGQGGQGQGRGGRGFGQGGRGGGNNELTLAMRKDVQTDLGVSEDQKKKLEELQTKLRPARGQRGQGGQAGAGGAGGQGGNGGQAGAGGQRGQGGQGGNFDPEAMRKRMEEQRAATRKALSEVLSADQMKRLGEISIQLQGNRAVLNAEVQKSLGVTDEQKAKITELQTKMQEANRALMQKVRDQELSQEDAQKSMQNNNKAMDDELAKLLNATQNAKLKEMGGKPFKADPNETGRRGGGGGLS